MTKLFRLLVPFLALAFMGCDVSDKITSSASKTDDRDKELVHGLNDVTGQSNFVLPVDAVSFFVTSYPSNGETTVISQVRNIRGPDVMGELNDKDVGIYFSGTAFANVLVPMIPDHQALPGYWSLSSSHANKTYVTVRTGDTPSSSTLPIQPFLTGTQYSSSDVSTGLSGMKSIFESAGLQVALEDIQTLSNSSLATLDGSTSTLQTLLDNASLDKINVFFVEDDSSSPSGTLGYASSIGAPFKLNTNYNYVIILLTSHVSNSIVNTGVLGETVAHEIGHLLGLFHTTERTGTDFDPLSDTPECSLSISSSVSASECDGYGGRNLMFWTSASFSQKSLSNDQVYILNYSPYAY